MSISKRGKIVLFFLFAFVAVASWRVAEAQQDVAHLVSGFVKHVDHDAKTMVVKTADGSEHTIKWTGETAWEGTKDAGKDIKDGTKVSVKYTEKGGEKTAVGVKDIGKDAAKAVK
jgi:hypothetical protein